MAFRHCLWHFLKIFKRTKKHVATKMTRRLGEIFLVKCQKQAFSFNKREAKVYCYASDDRASLWQFLAI
jgi:hypothetical protein